MEKVVELKLLLQFTRGRRSGEESETNTCGLTESLSDQEVMGGSLMGLVYDTEGKYGTQKPVGEVKSYRRGTEHPYISYFVGRSAPSFALNKEGKGGCGWGGFFSNF